MCKNLSITNNLLYQPYLKNIFGFSFDVLVVSFYCYSRNILHPYLLQIVSHISSLFPPQSTKRPYLLSQLILHNSILKQICYFDFVWLTYVIFNLYLFGECVRQTIQFDLLCASHVFLNKTLIADFSIFLHSCRTSCAREIFSDRGILRDFL